MVKVQNIIRMGKGMRVYGKMIKNMAMGLTTIRMDQLKSFYTNKMRSKSFDSKKNCWNSSLSLTKEKELYYLN